MRNIIFSEVNAYHKQLSNIIKYLLEHTENDQDEIRQASEFLNLKICELYKRRHM